MRPLDEYGYPIICFPDCGNRKPDGSECDECRAPDLTKAEVTVTSAPMTDLHAAISAALDEQEADAKALRGPFRSVTPHALRRIEADRRVLARHAADEHHGPVGVCLWCQDDLPCPDLLDLAARYDVEVPRD